MLINDNEYRLKKILTANNSCFDVLSNSVNDLSLLFEVQKCFHQADILELLSSQQKNTKKSWQLRTFKAVFVLLQIVMSAYSIFIHGLQHSEANKNSETLQKTCDALHRLEHQQESTNSVVSTNTAIAKENIQTLQEKLGKLDDLSKELESFQALLDYLAADFTLQQSFYFASYFPSVALVSPEYDESPKNFSNTCVANSASLNKPTWGKKTNRLETFGKHSSGIHPEPCESPGNRDFIHEPMVHKGAHNTLLVYSTRGNENVESLSSFDISTQEGRQRWKQYIAERLENGKTRHRDTSTAFNGSGVLQPIDTEQASNKVVDLKKHLTSSSPTQGKNQKLRYMDICKTDQNNKRFRRIFILGRGWVSTKKLEEEEKELGSSSFVLEKD